MENEKNSTVRRTTETDMRLIERARRRGMTPYNAGPECMDECLRLDEKHRSSFWRSVMYQMMEEEFNATVAIPRISSRRAE